MAMDEGAADFAAQAYYLREQQSYDDRQSSKARQRERYEAMLELIARRDPSAMITHRFALDDFVEAFASASSPDAGAKVMIQMR